MQSEISSAKPKFNPVTLKLTFESEAEARVLMAILGASVPRDIYDLWGESEQSSKLDLEKDEVCNTFTLLDKNIRVKLKEVL